MASIKSNFFGLAIRAFVSVLPPVVVVRSLRIIRRRFGNDALSILRERGQYSAAACLLEKQMAYRVGRFLEKKDVCATSRVSLRAPVLIAGPTRIGKSRLAQRVAEQLDCRVISTDELRPIYLNPALPKDAAKEAKGYVYRATLSSKCGVILEGDALISDHYLKGAYWLEPYRVDLHRAVSLARECDAALILIGSEDRDWVMENLAVDPGWAASVPPSDLADFASVILDASRELRVKAAARSLIYFELSEYACGDPVKKVSEEICQYVRYRGLRRS